MNHKTNLLKTILTILFISINLTSCSQKSSTMKIEIDTNKMITPLYSLKVISANPYETYINDIILEKDYTEGATEYELLINEYILQSGNQLLKLRLFPNMGNEFVDQQGVDSAKMIIYRYPKGFESYNKNEKIIVKEIVLPKMQDTLKIYQFEDVFLAEVPYKIDGWSKSYDLKNDDYDTLIKETYSLYNEVKDNLNKGDYSFYMDKLKKRDDEVFGSMNATKNIIEEDQKYMQDRIRKSKGKMMDIKESKPFFYANNKIITLELSNGKSPLYAQDESIDYRYRLLLHRPKKGAPLEIIR